jgi:gas vesicle protein
MADSKDFMIGVLVGSAIGAAAALLYAPQSGTDTRILLKTRADEAKDRTAEMAQQARARASELANTAQGRIGEVRGQVQAKAGEITNQAQELVDRGRHMVEQQKEAVLSAVEAGRQAYTEKQNQLQQEVAEDTLPPTPTS